METCGLWGGLGHWNMPQREHWDPGLSPPSLVPGHEVTCALPHTLALLCCPATGPKATGPTIMN